MKPDFSGYATKANVPCSDGRTIMPEAFAHMDGAKVPLVWQHDHNDPTNVLGHAFLEHRHDGMYARAYFNNTEKGISAKEMVKHGDIVAMSIYANRLVESNKVVRHGVIREVSLVYAGANPEALIDEVNLEHSVDGMYAAVIYTGDEIIIHNDEDENVSDKTIKEIFDSMTEEQKNVVYFMVGEAAKGSVEHSDDISYSDNPDVQEVLDSMNDLQLAVVHGLIEDALEENTIKHSNEEGITMAGLFENNSSSTGTLAHADFYNDVDTIFADAKRIGSLKEAVLDNALKHGIDNIDILFPEAKDFEAGGPEHLKRRTEWVNEVISGTSKTPFAKVRSLHSNLTLEEARAKGYVKGRLKKEEFFKVSKRETGPQTVYKKQKLDRDDILDITSFDVVIWLKAEMRLMLEEEIARAILIGDGRSAGDDDKIDEDKIRPIANDHDFYVTKLFVNLDDADSSAEEIIDALVLQRRHYRGSGNPVFFTSETILAKLLLIKDKQGRRIYPTVNDVAVAIRASKIVTVEVMDEPTNNIVGILVNLKDYNVGTNKGGQVSLFDDFDIDYNQHKYLIETRLSGALVKAKSALVVQKVAASSVLVTPVAPTWDAANHRVTVATTTGITYKNKVTNATLATANPITLAQDEELTIIAVPASSSYHLSSTAEDEFFFTYEDGLNRGTIL